MEMEVRLPAFEGPLALLLHLIDKNKVDIYDIPIAQITDQYLDYVARMETADLDLMSDFLVMAATLLDIKTRMLLPVPEEEEEDGGDPRAELVARLLEYRKYKLLGEELHDMEVGSDHTFYRGTDLPEEVAAYRSPVELDALLAGVDAARLRAVFEEVMGRFREKQDREKPLFDGKIRREKIQLSGRLAHVRRLVRRFRRQSFRELLSSSTSRTEVIITFIAVLELLKTGEIRLTEDSTAEDFILEGKDDGEESGGH